MMNNKKLLLLIGLAVAGLLVVIVAGLMSAQQQPTGPNESGVDPSTPEAPTGLEAEVEQPQPPAEEQLEEDQGSYYITNFSVLASNFEVGDALFINDSVQEFALAQNFALQGLELDDVSFEKRSETSWGFMVRDNQGNRIFYVIVTRLPEGNLKIEEFLQ